MGVGVQTVPPHQLFDGRCLRSPHGQILLDFGFDLLSSSHGEDGTWRGRQAGGAEKKKQVSGHSPEAGHWETPALMSSEAAFLFPSGLDSLF